MYRPASHKFTRGELALVRALLLRGAYEGKEGKLKVNLRLYIYQNVPSFYVYVYTNPVYPQGDGHFEYKHKSEHKFFIVCTSIFRYISSDSC